MHSEGACQNIFIFFFLIPADSAVYLPFLWRAEINRYTMSQHLIREVQQLKHQVAKLLEERTKEGDHSPREEIPAPGHLAIHTLSDEIRDLQKRVHNLETLMNTPDL